MKGIAQWARRGILLFVCLCALFVFYLAPALAQDAPITSGDQTTSPFDMNQALVDAVKARYGDHVSPSDLAKIAKEISQEMIASGQYPSIEEACYDPVYDTSEYKALKGISPYFGNPKLWTININFTVSFTHTAVSNIPDLRIFVGCYQEYQEVNPDPLKKSVQTSRDEYESLYVPRKSAVPLPCFELGGTQNQHIEVDPGPKSVLGKNGKLLERTFATATFDGNVYLWCPFSMVASDEIDIPSPDWGVGMEIAVAQDGLVREAMEQFAADSDLYAQFDEALRETLATLPVGDALLQYPLDQVPIDVLQGAGLEELFPELREYLLPDNLPAIYQWMDDSWGDGAADLLRQYMLQPEPWGDMNLDVGILNAIGVPFELHPSAIDTFDFGNDITPSELPDADTSSAYMLSPLQPVSAAVVDLLDALLRYVLERDVARTLEEDQAAVETGYKEYDHLLAVSAIRSVQDMTATLYPLIEYKPECGMTVCADDIVGYRQGLEPVEGQELKVYQQLILAGDAENYLQLTHLGNQVVGCPASVMEVSQLGAQYAAEECSATFPTSTATSPVYALSELGSRNVTVDADSICSNDPWYGRVMLYHFNTPDSKAKVHICSGDNLSTVQSSGEQVEQPTLLSEKIRLHVGPVSIFFGYDSDKGVILSGKVDYFWFDPDQGKGI